MEVLTVLGFDPNDELVFEAPVPAVHADGGLLGRGRRRGQCGRRVLPAVGGGRGGAAGRAARRAEVVPRSGGGVMARRPLGVVSGNRWLALLIICAAAAIVVLVIESNREHERRHAAFLAACARAGHESGHDVTFTGARSPLARRRTTRRCR